MKFLVLDTYYPSFLRRAYAGRPGLAEAPFEEQRAHLLGLAFGTADFFSRNLRALGHEAEELIVNGEAIQRMWAREHGLSVRGRGNSALFEILEAQIRTLRPDVLHLQDVPWTPPDLVRRLREVVPLVTGQTSYPLPPGLDVGPYDLLFTPVPHFVEMYRRRGVPVEFLRIAFDPSVLERLGPVPVTRGAVFVGGYAGAQHGPGAAVLEAVSRRAPVEFFGYGVEALQKDSPIRSGYRGEAWGIDMYRVLASSRIALNRHGPVAGRHAANMRLYEATGTGTMLLTDRKDDLGTLFELDREVVAWDSAEECAEKIRWYLDHESERAAIAAAGRARTLREHTYRHRMEELAHHARTRIAGTRRSGAPHFLSPSQPSGRATSGRVHTAVARIPGARFGARVLRRIAALGRRTDDGYRRIDARDVTPAMRAGWQDPEIPLRQRALVEQTLFRMYQGDTAAILRVAADAVTRSGCARGSILEVGCASGYHEEALVHLLGHPVDYTGVDYSAPLVDLARRCNPGVPFLVGDATALPCPDRSVDLVFSGTVILHVPEWERVVSESARVARRAVVFHKTPVVPGRETIWLAKRAYGIEVVELAFGREALEESFAKNGLVVEAVLPCESFHPACLPSPIEVVTHVCRVH